MNALDIEKTVSRERTRQIIYYCGQEIRGRIAAKQCAHCGHHELIIESDRSYLPLRPGMKIIIEADPDYVVKKRPITAQEINRYLAEDEIGQFISNPSAMFKKGKPHA